MATRRSKKSTKKNRSASGAEDASSTRGLVKNEESAPLHQLAQERYLNYALSVITSRALPDVRDGLKPVQRRILFTMWRDHLTADAKHRKCAKIVGDVMGGYHPHGDTSIYDALVRMAQPFAMRAPLVNGSGNFGSMDGDPAAAMRYTECRLQRLAHALLDELDQDTVQHRPNYDGTKDEPVVLPSKVPNLLINGATGIAVGMATNIPPHNPEEVLSAAMRLLDALIQERELSTRELCRTIKGPDFPTGGQIVSTSEEIKQVYETGQGTIKLRATWELVATRSPVGGGSRGASAGRSGSAPKTKRVHITSIPYGVNKAALAESIAEVVTARKMPLLVDVRDISGENVCIELELQKDADEHKVLQYLYKHTSLQQNFNVNLTCLVPTENPDVGRPERLDLRSLLWHFLHFRQEVVTRRLNHELKEQKRRIHILEGFEAIFDALDQVLQLIRKSEGKADAAGKIMARFGLDAEQTDAILELKLYRLARLEILVIQKELKEKRARAREIANLLKDGESKSLWALVKKELEDVAATYGALQKRRTRLEAVQDEPEFSREELIVAEDNHVLVTRDGWVKRQKEIKDPGTTRLREGDAVLACLAGSTRATLVFFSSFGTAYTARFADIPATAGYGEPIQKLFKLRDGEAIVTALSLDPRLTGTLEAAEGSTPSTYALAASSDGYASSFGLDSFIEPSTKGGRRFAKVPAGHSIVGVEIIHGTETLIAVSVQRRVLLCPVGQVNFLSGPGHGVLAVKLDALDRLLAVKAVSGTRQALVVQTSDGREQRVSLGKYEISSRGGRGREIMKRGTLSHVVREAPPAPPPLEEAGKSDFPS